MKEEEKLTKREPSVISDIEFELIKARLKRDRSLLRIVIGSIRFILSSLILAFIILIDYEIKFYDGFSLYLRLFFLLSIIFAFFFEWYQLGKTYKTL